MSDSLLIFNVAFSVIFIVGWIFFIVFDCLIFDEYSRKQKLADAENLKLQYQERIYKIKLELERIGRRK